MNAFIRRWVRGRAEWLLILSIFACVVEGAARKWMLRGFGGVAVYLAYFAKDLLLLALVMFCPPRGDVSIRQSFKRVLMVGVPLTCIGATLSAVQHINWVGAVLSFRALIGLPLLVYFSLPRLAGLKIDKIVFVIAIFTALNAFLGVVQNRSPADAAINYYAMESLGAVSYEENVRAAGTFSYISGYSNLATVGSWAGLTLLCLAHGRLRYVLIGWGVYFASLVCALVSISRSTIIIVLLMLVLASISGKDVLGNLVKGVSAVAVLLFIGYALNLNPTISRWTDTIIARHETSEDTIEGRTLDPLLEVLPAAEIAPTGLGFGTEQVAGVFANTGVMGFAHFESQFPRLVLETGLIGLLGFLVTSGGALWVILKARKYITDEGLRRTCVLSAFLVGSFFYTNVAFNHIASFFAWVTVAVTLAASQKTPAIERVLPRQQVWETQPTNV